LQFENSGVGLMKGMLVTLKTLFKRPVTTQYPEEKLTPSKRIRGNQLVWNEEKCLVCTTCAKACPQGALHMVTAVDPQNPNKMIMEKIEVDTGYCIFCGSCVEACPYNALFMGYDYELARYRRGDLVQSNQDLKISDQRRPSAYMHPDKEAGLPRQSLLVEKKTGLR